LSLPPEQGSHCPEPHAAMAAAPVLAFSLFYERRMRFQNKDLDRSSRSRSSGLKYVLPEKKGRIRAATTAARDSVA